MLKGFRIGACMQGISMVSKLTLGLKHPVCSAFFQTYLTSLCPLKGVSPLGNRTAFRMTGPFWSMWCGRRRSQMSVSRHLKVGRKKKKKCYHFDIFPCGKFIWAKFASRLWWCDNSFLQGGTFWRQKPPVENSDILLGIRLPAARTPQTEVSMRFLPFRWVTL